MKKLFYLIFLLVSVQSFGQFTRFYTYNEYLGSWGDSITNIAFRDTTVAPYKIGETRLKSSDSTVYIALSKTDAKKWYPLKGYVPSGIGTGTVTSVGASFGGSAISISGTPVTNSGTLAFTWNGASTDIVLGNGSYTPYSTLITDVTNPLYSPLGHSHVPGDITNLTTYVRNLFSAGTGLVYNAATGQFSYPGAGAGITDFNGISDATQYLAIDTAYLGATSWSSVGSTHTLRLNARLFNASSVGNPNSNIGSGFRLAVPNTNNIKTLFNGYAIGLDSSSNTNGITLKADTSLLQTKLGAAATYQPIGSYVTSNIYVSDGYPTANRTVYMDNRRIIFRDSAFNNNIDFNFSPSGASYDLLSYDGTYYSDFYQQKTGFHLSSQNYTTGYKGELFVTPDGVRGGIDNGNRFNLDTNGFNLNYMTGASTSFVGVNKDGYLERLDTFDITGSHILFYGKNFGLSSGFADINDNNGVGIDVSSINNYTSNNSRFTTSASGLYSLTRYDAADSSYLLIDGTNVDSAMSKLNIKAWRQGNIWKGLSVGADNIQLQNLSSSSDTTTYKPSGLDANGNVVRMNYWPGSGSTGGYSVSNEANNRVITSTGSGTGYAETDLVFDGTNLGIGASPIISLDVASASGFAQIGARQGTSYLTFFASSAYGTAIYYDPAHDFRIGKGGTASYDAGSFSEQVRITATDGNLLVGYTSNQGAYKLQVNGDSYLNGNVVLPLGAGTYSAGGYDVLVLNQTTKKIEKTTISGGGTTTNALTFNNSGSGDASGTTFDGSAAKTISYNTIGAQGALTLTNTGSGAATLIGNTLNIPDYSGGTVWNGIIGGSAALTSTSLTITTGTAMNLAYQGSADATWTLPDRATAANRIWFIKNESSYNLTIQRAGSDMMYTTSSVTSTTLTPGESRTFIAGATTWDVHEVGGGTVTGGTGINVSSNVVSIKGWDDWNKVTVQTTNTTTTTIATISCPNTATGTLVVEMIGTKDDNSKSISGRKTVHWHSVAGLVTVDEIIDDNADYLRSFTTADWTIDASGGDLRIRATGESATNIDWSPTYKLKYNSYAL